MKEINALRLAISFLTAVPVGTIKDVDKHLLAKSTRYYPIVGLLIGVFLYAIYFLAGVWLNPFSVSAIVVVSLILITRGIHLDGLADTFDGILAGVDGDTSLKIMKDSHVGSFGVIAIVATLLLKIVLLADITPVLMLGALLSFPVTARTAATIILATEVPARKNDGLASTLMEEIKPLDGYIALAIGLAIVAIALRFAGIAAIVAVLVVALVALWPITQKLKGITGDVLGAMIEIIELAVIFGLALI